MVDMDLQKFADTQEAYKRAREIPTIDVCMVVIEAGDTKIALDTASKLGVEPVTEDVDAVKLVIKGKLKAQKGKTSTITGHTLVLTDNVFIPEVVKILQGGKLKYWTDETMTTTTETETEYGLAGYEPPASDSGEKGVMFKLVAYSAEYDTSGEIIQYEKTTYPNCQGTPITINTEDGVFRVSEYTIDSAPKKGESPYWIDYVKELPKLVDELPSEGEEEEGGGGELPEGPPED